MSGSFCASCTGWSGLGGFWLESYFSREGVARNGAGATVRAAFWTLSDVVGLAVLCCRVVFRLVGLIHALRLTQSGVVGGHLLVCSKR